ncbi:MAG: hypothetical protein MSJ26_05845 [Oscillospiraceae bacterium]|nr:hypothetical protein [Oscillospiraceae bacterium]
MKKTIAVILSAVIFGSASCVCVSADGVTEETLPVPDVDTEFKTYMDYRRITDTDSVQYALQQEAYTDSLGIRRIGEDVCVALGTAYTDSCGERFEITLDSGNTFTAIVGDIKDDSDTDPTNRYVELWEGHGDMVEFIVETEKLDKTVRIMGSIGEYDKYSGSITAIVPLDK